MLFTPLTTHACQDNANIISAPQHPHRTPHPMHAHPPPSKPWPPLTWTTFTHLHGFASESQPGGLGEEARALVKRGEGPARVAPNDGGGEAL